MSPRRDRSFFFDDAGLRSANPFSCPVLRVGASLRVFDISRHLDYPQLP